MYLIKIQEFENDKENNIINEIYEFDEYNKMKYNSLSSDDNNNISKDEDKYKYNDLSDDDNINYNDFNYLNNYDESEEDKIVN